jgi:hypothetical protein
MGAALPTDLPRMVKIRCEDCAPDLGRSAPTLVVALYETGDWARGSGLRDHWKLIALGERIPTRTANIPPRATPGPPPAPGVAVSGGMWNSSRTIDQHHPRGRAVELTCRRCKRSGWRRKRKLYGVAATARAAGRSDAYLSLR